jgi:hypothetical protein
VAMNFDFQTCLVSEKKRKKKKKKAKKTPWFDGRSRSAPHATLNDDGGTCWARWMLDQTMVDVT